MSQSIKIQYRSSSLNIFNPCPCCLKKAETMRAGSPFWRIFFRSFNAVLSPTAILASRSMQISIALRGTGIFIAHSWDNSSLIS